MHPSASIRRLTFAPKVPLAWIVRLYENDAARRVDDELLEKVRWRLYERCSDVLLVTDSQLACIVCDTVFTVPWIGIPGDTVSFCPKCDWQITAGEYHAAIQGRDLRCNARPAVEAFVARFGETRGYAENMRQIDTLVHAVHTTGGLLARNLIEGRATQVLATLDALAGSSGEMHR